MRFALTVKTTIRIDTAAMKAYGDNSLIGRDFHSPGRASRVVDYGAQSVKAVLPLSSRDGMPGLFLRVLEQLGGKFLKENGRVAGDGFAIFLAGQAVADVEGVHGAGYGHIKEATLFIEGAFLFGARVGQQTFFQADDVDAGKFQTLAAVHGDKSDGVTGAFVLVVLLGVQGDVLEKFLETVDGRIG